MQADDAQIGRFIPLASGATSSVRRSRTITSNCSATDGPTNNRKSDREPAQWLPPAQSVHYAYGVDWQRIADTYGLTVAVADTATVGEILAGW
jgi:hypothetical protein